MSRAPTSGKPTGALTRGREPMSDWPSIGRTGAPFSVAGPATDETPVIVEIPHAGLQVDHTSLGTLAAPARSLAADADLYVDELYANATEVGASVLVAHLNRYVCDLNRAESDVDPRAAEGGAAQNSPHGLIWWATTTGVPALTRVLARSELQRRIESYYRPYHVALRQLIAEKRARFGHAIVLCAHSMPSQGRVPGSRETVARADIVPGSRGRSSAAAACIDLPDLLARERGWQVSHDDPYRGGFTTAQYGQPSRGVHVIQVEIARRLYMDELSFGKNPRDFNKLQEYCRTLVARLGALQLR